jgi:hypothetical protein
MAEYFLRFVVGPLAGRQSFPRLMTAAGFVLILLNGCDSDRQNRNVKPPTNVPQDHLARAIDLVLSDDRFKYDVVNKDIANRLDNWGETHKQIAEWKRTELISTLPERLQKSKLVTELDGMKFSASDALYVQEAAWVKRIVAWASERKSPGDFRYLIAAAQKKMNDGQAAEYAESRNPPRDALISLHPELSVADLDSAAARTGKLSEIDELLTALKLFDWTVRNIQLARLPRPATEQQVREQALNQSSGGVPSLAGVAGPGYQHQPWHLLTNAYGDAWERGRLAIRLMREKNIDAAMLAVPDRDDESQLQPWLIGVAIGGEVYLFDPALGLPIPGEGLAGIATLSQVRSNPRLLSDLDLKPSESLRDIDYPVVKEQLTRVVALLDAPSESLSRRMAEMQSSLTGKQRLNLTLNADKLAETFSAAQGIDEVKLWEVPFLANEFRQAVAAAANIGSRQLDYLTDIKREAILDMKVALIDREKNDISYVGISLARHRFLNGMFTGETDGRLLGATQLYDQLRITDDEIEGFDSNAEWKSVYGLTDQSDLTAEEYQKSIQAIKLQFKYIRVDALYFLAMSHYENQLTSNALSMFNLYLGEARKGDFSWMHWQYSAEYMKGRCHEVLMEFDEAVSAYNGEAIRKEKGVSPPQYYGNVLRARLLKKWLTPEQNAE